MINKYKLIALLVIIAAVLAVLYLPDSDRTAAEDATGGTTAEVFSPNEEPYRDFIEARQANKPIFLEFYARY